MNKAALKEAFKSVVNIYEVELQGAYQGKYDVMVISKPSSLPLISVTVGPAKEVYITNKDIIELIKEAIGDDISKQTSL